jgi:glutathione S-transferase
MITVYHLDNSRSERIVWLMEELGLPYEQQTFMRENGVAPAAMSKIHPMGIAPLIKDGDQVIMESGAIVDYLIRRYGNGKLAPAVSSPEHVRYLEWLHFAEGSAMHRLVHALTVDRLAKDPSITQGASMRKKRMLDFIDQHLGANAYLVGSEFSGADVMMEFCFSFMERYAKENMDAYPNIAAWLKRVRARPAYQRAMQAAAPKVQFAR